MLSFFPRGVLDEILNLIGSVSEGFPSYSIQIQLLFSRYINYNHIEKEIQYVVHWFQGWSRLQKQDFLQDLIDKAIPCHMGSLFNSLRFMNVEDKPPSILQCQMKLFNQWFESWTGKERNDFMIKLREVYPEFVVVVVVRGGGEGPRIMLNSTNFDNLFRTHSFCLNLKNNFFPIELFPLDASGRDLKKFKFSQHSINENI